METTTHIPPKGATRGEGELASDARRKVNTCLNEALAADEWRDVNDEYWVDKKKNYFINTQKTALNEA